MQNFGIFIPFLSSDSAFRIPHSAFRIFFVRGRPMFYQSLFNLRIKPLHPVRLIFAVYIFGFAYGTRNHIVNILADGWLGYDFVPLPINLYWTILTFFDPLAIFLLLSFPFAGVILSVLIMASDIAINPGVTVYFYYQTGILSLDRLPLQIAFGMFVFITAPFAWRRIKKSTGKKAALLGRVLNPPLRSSEPKGNKRRGKC